MNPSESHPSPLGDGPQARAKEEELLRLCGVLLDDRLTEAEFARLKELLVDDAACRWYLDHIDTHARLLLQFEGESPSPPPEAMATVELAGRVLRRPAPLAMIISAVVCGVMLTAAAYIAAPMYWNKAHRPPNDDDAASHVAHVTGVDGATWKVGQIDVVKGRRLKSGDVLALSSGVAAISFNSSARIVVEGPIACTILNENAVRLSRGKLVAHVSPRAKGFTVETPFASIVDYGTEFGVEVERERVDAHVFVGEILLRSTVDPQTKATRLTAGQSASADREGIGRISLAADIRRFNAQRAFFNAAHGKGIVAASPPWPEGRGDPHYFPYRAIDNLTSEQIGMFWVGRDHTLDEYFVVDLREVLNLDRIELLPTHNGVHNDRGTKDYEIWVSLEIDASGELVAPRLIASGTLPNVAGLGEAIPVTHLPENAVKWKDINARYVKFVARTYYGLGCGLNEIRVFGEALPLPVQGK